MRIFHIDINSTRQCNLRCKYCYEANNSLMENESYKDPENFIKFCKDFMESDFFKSNYDAIKVNFWGGEPSLNKELFNHLMDEFLEDNRVIFFMFSNGFYIDDYYINLFKMLQKIKINSEPKFVMQVSYDGEIIHDIDRVDVKGKGSSEKVRQTLQKLIDNNIYYVMKSTISPKNFKHLYEAYLDVSKFLPQGRSYFPTIDLHLSYEEGDDSYKQHGQDLYEQLIKISSYQKQNGLDNFVFFFPNKALCAAGVSMIAVDINGNILPCHGALYTNYDEHLIGNVSDEDAIDKVINSSNWFKDFYTNVPEECKGCTNKFCLKCNVVKYEHSEKDKYEEKWTDHTCQPYQCYFFDIIDLVSRAHRMVS